MRFKDKVAIITGGTSGMGKEAVQGFSKQRASVVINDIPDQLKHFDQEFMEICARHTDHSVGDSETIDQANTILFLSTDASKCMTGQVLVVDKGMCL